MKRISYLIFSMLLVNVAWSQELHVGSTAAITTLPITENKIINNVKLLGNYSVTEFPVDYQIYKRDKTTSQSDVAVSGNCNSSSGFSSIILEVFRNDEPTPFLTETQNLSYVNDNAIFNFTAIINAELANYTFKLTSDTDIVLEEVSNVASGDIYIVTGQSNSINNSNPPADSNNYIRTFASPTNYTTDLKIISGASIGSIGHHFANEIVTNEKIPVLVLNGGRGNKAISYFQRNEANKYYTGSNYGLLLKRYTDAGLLPGDVTGIIWYQGENDGSDTSVTNYLNLFDDLYKDWKEDYDPTKFYVFQVHKVSCGVTTTASAIPEAHRQIANNYTDVKIISTNGALQGVDECHYIDTDGYEVLGKRLYKMLTFEVYNHISSSGIYSPDITNAKYFEKQNIISFDLLPATDIFRFESGAHSDFFLEDNTTVSITGGSVSGNRVTLTLSESIDNTEIFLGYLGIEKARSPYIKNQNDIGMLNFKNVRVEIGTGNGTNTQGNAGIGDAYGEVASATGKVWLDRNLGATQVAASSTDIDSYGDLYQWGRAADGHQVIVRDAASPASGSAPAAGSSANYGTQAGTFIANANTNLWDAKFITGFTDWLSAPIDNLWTGTAAENNPCPSGFRIPTNAELNQERASWTVQTSVGAINSPLKLPTAGLRNSIDGTLNYVGSHGNYWSSTVATTNNSRRLNFNPLTTTMFTRKRANGYSVRCIKD